MEVSEEAVNEDSNDEDEKPKKRRRRRRKKKQFSNDEGDGLNLDNTENRDSLDVEPTETSSSGENHNKEKGTNQSKRGITDDNRMTASSDSVEDLSKAEDHKFKEEDSVEKSSVHVDTEEKSNLKSPKDAKEKKKPATKKRIKKEVVNIQNADVQEDNVEEAKQKRKGWWSLKS
jgi:ribonuclease E